jgi:hypothetical protein
MRGSVLNSGDVLAAVLTNLRALFDNFGTKRAFTGKIPFMDFLDGLIDRLLQKVIAKFKVSDGFNSLQLTNVAEYFCSF